MSDHPLVGAVVGVLGRSVSVAVAVPILAGFASGYFGNPRNNMEAKGWYTNLKKSSLTPPSWVFPVAWTSLYGLMGYASHLFAKAILQSPPSLATSHLAQLGMGLYAGQLALNLAWTPLFFGAHNVGGALVDMAVLIPTVAACISVFNRVNTGAGNLLLPYLAWISFASYLNYKIWVSNPTIKNTKRN
eukprot:TRINITY_DN7575_c0_g2_i1.p1 TRINITY_DN7575_c0_g2~~TRINITY_DN7575_c0_g2_i1.p1  ORF type:complete len:188 (-),score=39.59 TRINITY_DN7575_c0_g2_i1:53-616(-)